MNLRTLFLPVVLAACGGPLPAEPEAVDAGQPADAGVDPFAGEWRFKGTVDIEPLEFTLTMTRAADGNYLGQLGSCALPMELLNATTLNTVAVVCDFTEADLSMASYHGLRPVFGGSLSLRFVAGARVQHVAGTISASGTVINQHFPDVQRAYTFTAQRR